MLHCPIGVSLDLTVVRRFLGFTSSKFVVILLLGQGMHCYWNTFKLGRTVLDPIGLTWKYLNTIFTLTTC